MEIELRKRNAIYWDCVLGEAIATVALSFKLKSLSVAMEYACDSLEERLTAAIVGMVTVERGCVLW